MDTGEALAPGESFVELLWIPVGAGTRFQKASLLLYETVAAWVTRRPRGQLLHAALKIGVDGRHYTLEVTPAPAGPNNGEVTGPVGIRAAGRLRLFRYQVCLQERRTIPDEDWAVGEPVRLSEDSEVAERVMRLAWDVPAHTWGRKSPGRSEMWTSNSCAYWMLEKAGLEPGNIPVPGGCRAPGWP